MTTRKPGDATERELRRLSNCAQDAKLDRDVAIMEAVEDSKTTEDVGQATDLTASKVQTISDRTRALVEEVPDWD